MLRMALALQLQHVPMLMELQVAHSVISVQQHLHRPAMLPALLVSTDQRLLARPVTRQPIFRQEFAILATPLA